MPLLYLQLLMMHSTNTNNDTELWELVRQGDYAAFEQLYQLYINPIFAAVYGHIKHKADAEDITQEVFLELWEKKATILIRRSVFNYLYSMARYKTLHYIRVNNIRPLSLELFQALLEDMSPPAEEARLPDLTLHLSREIALLPEQMKKVFALHTEAGMSITGIAEQLLISPNTVRNHLAKVRRRLRQTISRLFTMFFSLSFLLLAVLPNH